jgi:hypothetical protein
MIRQINIKLAQRDPNKLNRLSSYIVRRDRAFSCSTINHNIINGKKTTGSSIKTAANLGRSKSKSMQVDRLTLNQKECIDFDARKFNIKNDLNNNNINKADSSTCLNCLNNRTKSNHASSINENACYKKQNSHRKECIINGKKKDCTNNFKEESQNCCKNQNKNVVIAVAASLSISDDRNTEIIKLLDKRDNILTI